MLFAQRVVVFADRDKRRPGAISFIMDVDAMQTRRQATHVDVDANHASVLRKGG